MALILHQPGTQPLGQFDGYGTETLTFKGGEICTWRAELQSQAAGAGAADVPNDGYLNEGGLGFVDPAVSKDWAGMGTNAPPFFLADDGLKGYGTLFGTVVGGGVGTTAYGPNSTVASANLLGPHTATGSGKITLWDKQGLYGVTLDAVDTTNLTPTTTGLTVGMPLYYTSAGLLTTTTGKNTGGIVIGRLAEFETNGSLVTTPQNLVAALNSPSSSVSSLQQQKFFQVVFWFYGAYANSTTI
jgi:hypothetical protein